MIDQFSDLLLPYTILEESYSLHPIIYVQDAKCTHIKKTTIISNFSYKFQERMSEGYCGSGKVNKLYGTRKNSILDKRYGMEGVYQMKLALQMIRKEPSPP